MSEFSVKSISSKLENDVCLLKQRRHLQNWTKWLDIRKKFHDKMKFVLYRNAHELVLNKSDNFRQQREEKDIIEHSKVIKPTEKGVHPCFWEVPDLRSKKHPSLIAMRSKKQTGQISDIEYVAVPHWIQKEKGVFNEKGTHEGKTEYIKSKMHKPEIDELVIVGKAIDIKPEGSLAHRHTNIKLPRKSSEVKSEIVNKVETIAALQIEDVVFSSTDRKQSAIKHCIAVSYDASKTAKALKELTVTNVGNLTVKYNWKRIFEKKHAVDCLPARTPKYAFIFKKNANILTFGKRDSLRISFQTTIPGIHEEVWELRTEPTVFTVGQFRLVLRANVRDSGREEMSKAIRDRIEDGMKLTVVDAVLRDLMRRVFKFVTPVRFLSPGWVVAQNGAAVEAADALANRTNTSGAKYRKDYNKFIDRPVRIQRKQLQYNYVYTILSETIDNISQLIEDARKKFNIYKSTTYPEVESKESFECIEIYKSPIKQPDASLESNESFEWIKICRTTYPQAASFKSNESSECINKNAIDLQIVSRRNNDCEESNDLVGSICSEFDIDRMPEQQGNYDNWMKRSLMNLIDELPEQSSVEDQEEDSVDLQEGQAPTTYDLIMYNYYLYSLTHKYLGNFADQMDAYLIHTVKDPPHYIAYFKSENYLSIGDSSTIELPTQKEIRRVFNEFEQQIEDTSYTFDDTENESPVSSGSSEENLVCVEEPICIEAVSQGKGVQTDEIPEEELTDIIDIVEHELNVY